MNFEFQFNGVKPKVGIPNEKYFFSIEILFMMGITFGLTQVPPSSRLCIEFLYKLSIFNKGDGIYLYIFYSYHKGGGIYKIRDTIMFLRFCKIFLNLSLFFI